MATIDVYDSYKQSYANSHILNNFQTREETSVVLEGDSNSIPIPSL